MIKRMFYRGLKFEISKNPDGIWAAFIDKKLIIGTISKDEEVCTAFVHLQIDALLDMETKPLEIGDVLLKDKQLVVITKINKKTLEVRSFEEGRNDYIPLASARLLCFTGLKFNIKRKELKYTDVMPVKYKIGMESEINRDTKVWVEV